MPLAPPGSRARFYQDASRVGGRFMAAGALAAGVAAPYVANYLRGMYGRATEHIPAVTDYQMERVGALPQYHTNTTYDAAQRVQSLQAPARTGGPVSRGSVPRVMYSAAYRPSRRGRSRRSGRRAAKSGVYTGPRKSLGIKGMITGGLLGLQLKFVDWQGGFSVVHAVAAGLNSFGTLLPEIGDPANGHCTPVPLGDGPSSRTSNRIAVKSILFQVQMYCMIEKQGIYYWTAPADVEFAMYLVLDTQTSGSIFDAGDVWNAHDSQGVATLANLRNMVNVSRYRVLKTWKYRAVLSSLASKVVDGDTLASFMACGTVSCEEFMPIDGIVQKYDPTNNTGDVSGVVDNSLHLCFAYRFVNSVLGGSSEAPYHHAGAVVNARVRYYAQ